MKIVCIGRNYVDHAKELNNAVPTEPVVFMKPDSALLRESRPFYHPDFSNDIHHEIEFVVKICKIGKHIEEKFAHKYYNEVSIGIDFTARDLQQECKEKGLPWEKAKAFDSSAVIGKWIDKSNLSDINNTQFHLTKNGETVQDGNTKDMLFSIDKIISYVSQFYMLKIGDLIYTGTPAGVSKVSIGDRLEGFLEGERLFFTNIK